jgi:hypothetical protein
VVDGSRGVSVVNARIKVRSTAVLVRAGRGGGGGGGGGGGVPTESVSFSGTAVLSAAMSYRLQVGWCKLKPVLQAPGLST